MASSSGTSSGSGSTAFQKSRSEEDVQELMDQRKRKRMISNRESARRSRLRKQKHLDDLLTQVTLLKKENSQMLASLSSINGDWMRVEAENAILGAQVVELSRRLRSLCEIIAFVNCETAFWGTEAGGGGGGGGGSGIAGGAAGNPWTACVCMNQQPIMASANSLFG